MNIGIYVERFVDWLSDIGAPFFDQLTIMIENSIDALQKAIDFLPFYIVILILTSLIFWLKFRKLEKGSKFKDHFKELLGLPIFFVLGMAVIHWMGYWNETMETLVLVIVSTFLSLIVGIPLGIWGARSSTAYAVIRPILDFMQTMPAFVYLIPAILFFSVGNVPGVLATVIFSLPPAVRMTTLGITNVPKEIIEASVAFGCTYRQTLMKVQIPLAMPTILAGINQVIMLALSMVVIASMVGAGGLGESVYAGIQQADVALGFEAGLCIVILAIILDRLTQSLQGKQNNATN